MTDELGELMDAAIYKEISSNAFYVAGERKTGDSGAQALMRELAAEELKHAERLKSLKEKGLAPEGFHLKEVANLRLSEYLAGGESVDGAGLQETLTYAMKREQHAVEFYVRMMAALVEEEAKRLAEWLAQQELRHKLRLEILYDNMFYRGHQVTPGTGPK